MSPRLAVSVAGTSSATAVGSCRDRLAEEVISLFDEFRDPLLRYMSSFGLSISDSEDVLQDVFLSLFRHLQCGKPRDNLRGWLFRVSHNLALKHRGRSRRDFEVQAVGVEDFAVDPGPGPEDQLSQNQTRQRMLAVVAALPEQDRRCLFLRSEGLRYREITTILDMSLGAVSLSLTRSLARIARCSER